MRAADQSPRPAVPIIQHEDLRRMLMYLKAGSEAMRRLRGLSVFHPTWPSTIRMKRCAKKPMLEWISYSPGQAYPPDLGYCSPRRHQVLGGRLLHRLPVEQYARTRRSSPSGRAPTTSNPGPGGPQAGCPWREGVPGVVAGLLPLPSRTRPTRISRPISSCWARRGHGGDFAQSLRRFFKQGRNSLVPCTPPFFLECFADAMLANLMLERAGCSPKAGPRWSRLGGRHFSTGKVATAKFFAATS